MNTKFSLVSLQHEIYFGVRFMKGNILCEIHYIHVDMYTITVELQWLKHLWNHENMFETGVVQMNESVNHSTRSGGIIGIYYRFSFT